MTNPNSRLEMFADGVFAIAITLLVLDLRMPPVAEIHSMADVWNKLAQLWPSLFAMIFSFVIIFVSWIGHHNMLANIDKSSPQFQLANGYFLFTIIIIPFPTSFMAEYLDTPYAKPAILVYCVVACFHNSAWVLLNRCIRKPILWLRDSADLPKFRKAENGSRMGFALYATLTVLALWLPYVALAINAMTWIFWLYLSISVKPGK